MDFDKKPKKMYFLALAALAERCPGAECSRWFSRSRLFLGRGSGANPGPPALGILPGPASVGPGSMGPPMGRGSLLSLGPVGDPVPMGPALILAPVGAPALPVVQSVPDGPGALILGPLR